MTDITRRAALAAATSLAAAPWATAKSASAAPALKGSTIRHTVVFRLKWPSGSKEEAAFFAATDQLAALPQVRRFERLRQVSQKNKFAFDLSMEFDDESAYASYNNHPVHQQFLREQWKPNVEEFMEIDYVAYG